MLFWGRRRLRQDKSSQGADGRDGRIRGYRVLNSFRLETDRTNNERIQVLSPICPTRYELVSLFCSPCASRPTICLPILQLTPTHSQSRAHLSFANPSPAQHRTIQHPTWDLPDYTTLTIHPPFPPHSQINNRQLHKHTRRPPNPSMHPSSPILNPASLQRGHPKKKLKNKKKDLRKLNWNITPETSPS